LKVAASMYHIFSKHSVEDAKEFFHQLGAGKDKATVPVETFREELISDAKKKTNLPYNTVLAYMIKAWNAFREGKRKLDLVYDKESEKFPMPV
jgi:hypothetical protein